MVVAQPGAVLSGDGECNDPGKPSSDRMENLLDRARPGREPMRRRSVDFAKPMAGLENRGSCGIPTIGDGAAARA